jgi:hypothetical protein
MFDLFCYLLVFGFEQRGMHHYPVMGGIIVLERDVEVYLLLFV